MESDAFKVAFDEILTKMSILRILCPGTKHYERWNKASQITDVGVGRMFCFGKCSVSLFCSRLVCEENIFQVYGHRN